MVVKLRLSGEPNEIRDLIDDLRETYDVAGGDRSYPNRGAFGVRVYLEIRPIADTEPPAAKRRARTERVHPHRKEIEP